MKILVTGGAGYIGSFMVNRLLEEDYEVVVFDNLERGHKEVIESFENESHKVRFIIGDIRDRKGLQELFENEQFDAVIHFAGYISVEESNRKPEMYFQNNVIGSKNLFELAITVGNVKRFIFSSSAAVYGNPLSIPIPEDHQKRPTSEYGKTKLEVEEMLTSLRNSQKHSLVSFVCLRYFNAAGGSINHDLLGENHIPETHIIPLAIKATLNNEEFNLYGTDYNTPDGTCIRDYIHVLDLVEAQSLALKKLQKEEGGFFYNVGTGNGYSNREVLAMIEKVSGRKIKVREKPRRIGDPDKLIADVTKIKKELNFSPQYSDLETIIKSAWE